LIPQHVVSHKLTPAQRATLSRMLASGPARKVAKALGTSEETLLTLESGGQVKPTTAERIGAVLDRRAADRGALGPAGHGSVSSGG
jgi:xanthine/CO dehydrogenase XdhC/CoxF family maturation factor